MARYLFVVSRLCPELYEELARDFRDDPVVEVIFDRRIGERRRVTRARASLQPERRQRDRRTLPASHHDIALLGYALIRVESD